MKELIIKTTTEEDFFSRGRALAKLADAGKKLPEKSVISFEDPTDLLKLLTVSKLNLFRAIKEQPDSITGIAQRLHRDRSAVKRDIDSLTNAGLVTVEKKVLPGHGLMKEVRTVAKSFKLEAQLS